MNTQFANQPKPTLVSIIAWMTLASGIVNLVWGIAAISTTFLGFICAPLFILQIILGAFELVHAAKFLGTYPQGINKPSTNIAAFEIACVLAGNVFSMAVGILALVFYNDTVVRDYFARLNGTPVPVTPVIPTEPAPMPELKPFDSAQDKPAPVTPEPSTPPAEESPTPQPEETPAKPKRTPRKMAKK